MKYSLHYTSLAFDTLPNFIRLIFFLIQDFLPKKGNISNIIFHLPLVINFSNVNEDKNDNTETITTFDELISKKHV